MNLRWIERNGEKVLQHQVTGVQGNHHWERWEDVPTERPERKRTFGDELQDAYRDSGGSWHHVADKAVEYLLGDEWVEGLARVISYVEVDGSYHKIVAKSALSFLRSAGRGEGR